MSHAYLGSEADHFFVAAVMMLGILTVLAVVAAVSVWQWRAHRGPLMVAALTSVRWPPRPWRPQSVPHWRGIRYPAVDFDAVPVTPEHRVHYFTQAPSVFFGPHTGPDGGRAWWCPRRWRAFVYALLAVSAARDDLGAYPPEDPPGLPAPIAVTADGALPPVR